MHLPESKKTILQFQPDALELEKQPVPGRVRWILYLILCALVFIVIGAILLQVDRIVVAPGKLITTTPQIVVQPLERAIIRSIDVEVGELVAKDQVLTTLDATFSRADLDQLQTQQLQLGAQIRRIQAELNNTSFSPLPEEGEEGKLQKEVLQQRRLVETTHQQRFLDKMALLRARLAHLEVKRRGQEEQLQVLHDVEELIGRQALINRETRLQLLEARKERFEGESNLESLQAEASVVRQEVHQAQSEWQSFVEERRCALMEEEVGLRSRLDQVTEAVHKARRMHELIYLRAPQKSIVLHIAERSVGSVLQQAEPFILLVPCDAALEAQVNIRAQDIGRIRSGDQVRLKLEAFPFQRHGTLLGQVRVISENAFDGATEKTGTSLSLPAEGTAPFYRARISLSSPTLRDVPQGARLLPGMKLRAEIKIGTRAVITYFLYPVIRVFDESLREP